MTDPCFLAAISRDTRANWEICKEHRLWGCGRSSRTKHAAERIEPGDTILVWRGPEGLIAAAEATGPATEVGPTTFVPWPNPQRYRYTIPIDVVVELDEPIGDRFVGNVSQQLGLTKQDLHSGFILLPSEMATRILDAFEERAGTVRSDRTTQAAARGPAATRPAAGVHLQRSGSVVEAMLHLYRLGAHAEGELLVIGADDQRADFEREVAQAPFADLRHRFRFTTTEELAARLRAEMDGEDHEWH